ncbi:MAG TPA: nuclear transport factor 2 family protein [Acidimicrobiales bacterium]|nr:nuclear transport factor 2 family protein [Acidimicrobiales bacterium]
MTPHRVTLQAIDDQEEVFAAAFRAGDISGARRLYHDDIVYLSPTTRLFGWPGRIEGRDRALEFIQLTITGLADIDYGVDERAVVSDDSAYTRIRFDFDVGARRLRSVYVVVYRYRDGLICQQELYYDPSAHLDEV